MLKKLTALLLFVLVAVSLSACALPAQADSLTIVATSFPEYDWVRQIIGSDSGISLILLMDDGVDPHSFQPTVGDIVTVRRCDLLIYGGGESDEWLEDVLEDDDSHALALLPLLGEQAHAAEVIPGMQVREAEDEIDEHVWLSLRNAKLFCREIAQAICRLDPENAHQYQQSLADYTARLDALDERYCQTVQSSSKDTILLCDRFPFRYLVEDYGLNYYAAFPGCSSESGASFETIVFLSDRVRELDLDIVLTLEGSDQRLAQTVAENSGRENVRVMVLDSMQSVSGKDASYRDYLATMEQNRQVLEAALG